MAGLAKRFEELYVPGRSAPIILPAKTQGLYLVQRIRDEAHRFAITYHRTVRGRRALASVFDDVPGIGPARKKALLKRFGQCAGSARHRSMRWRRRPASAGWPPSG